MAEKHVILIVDDTPENLQVLGRMLEERGYEVLVATTGPQALATVEASPPDLILLDILMPEMDGFAVCRRLKADPRWQAIPLIFLSVLDLPEQKLQAFQEGAVDYITKPFQSEEVVARVHTHLQLTQLAVLQREIAERARVEEALQEQAEELSAIYDEAPLIMMIVNEEMAIQKINSPVRALASRPLAELIGRPIGEAINCLQAPEGCGLSPDCLLCEIRRTSLHTFTTGESQQQVQGHLRFFLEGREHDGFFLISTKRLNFRKKPAVLLCLLDVSEQHRLLDQVVKQQKMESIGTLAGGIAHDFNNILSAIVGYTDLALMRGEEEFAGAKDDLGQVRKAAYRATDLVRQILTFSRQQPQEKQPLQIAVVVKEALKLLRASIPTTIEIRQEIESSAITVLADPTQIHQMVMNLCTNAYHAMMEVGGVLTVSLRELAIDQKMIDSGVELPPGRYATVSVRDTGCGMDRETIAKIFDPYFTTKELGKGTGLGLAVVDGIVKTHQGRIAVYSEPGNGTIFNIYLPTIAAEATATVAVEEPPGARAHERVMVVEDETPIRTLICRFLSQAGYRVEAFADGLAAWQAFADAPGAWDLLLSDQTMPRLTGDKLAAKVLAVRPELPIILCSGYQANVDRERVKGSGVFLSLQKPISRTILLNQVAQALARSGG